MSAKEGLQPTPIQVTPYHIMDVVDSLCSPDLQLDYGRVGVVWPRPEDMRGAGESEAEEWAFL